MQTVNEVEQIEDQEPPRRGGLRAILGAAVAVVGVVAAANPQNPVLRAVNVALPALADVIPTIVTVCGAAVAAYSEPPKLPARFRR